MRQFSLIFCLFGLVVLIFGFTSNKAAEEADSVVDILELLGDNSNAFKVNNISEKVSAEAGYNIVHFGMADGSNSAKVKRQSRHFVCTSCHNVEKEDPDLSVNDPQARLEFTVANGLPFLQATTLYGAVNRTQFYNGDYEKKYGGLVKPARNDLREAIQLCAVECSQGRILKDWELESVLSYLWTIDLKIDDLNFTIDELSMIDDGISGKMNSQKAIDLIKSKYLDYSDAHFLAPPDDRKAGYGLEGDPENGKLIYENSCQHCHKNRKYSYFNIDDSKLTFQFLHNKFDKYSRYSIYQVGRYGTQPKMWKRSYMPQYTEEKMSKQQMSDLRAYIAAKAQ